MTPLMLSAEVNNFAFLVELPVEAVFSDNEDIQTIQIDECSSLSSTAVNNAIQPMIIASTDSQGNCFVTLQDEQTYNSCSSWNGQSEVATTTPAPEAVLQPTPAKALTARAETVATRASTASTRTTSITSRASTIVPKRTAGIASLASSVVTASSSTLKAHKKAVVTTVAKTDSQPVTTATHVPTITKIVNRQAVGLHSYTRWGRNRMIADNITSIPVPEFKAQLNDTSDIIGKLDLAPTTKRRMNLLQWKGIGKLFASPGQKFMSTKLLKIFTRNLRTRLLELEETFSDMELLPIGYKPEVDPTKIKRITRRRRYPEAEEYQRRMLQEQMEQTLQNFVSENQTQMETVYLDNADTFKDQSQETMQVLVESTDSASYTQTEENRVVDVFGNDHTSESSIIVIHNSQETNQESAYTHQNIEVLLAAAGENGLNSENIHQVFICDSEDSPESVLPCASSIIIVPNDTLTESITETVVST